MTRRVEWALLILAAVCLGAGCKQAEKHPDADHRGNSQEAGGIEAVYPEMASYPDEADYKNAVTGEFDDDGYFEAYERWAEERRARRISDQNAVSGLNPFFVSSIRQFLNQETGEPGENRIYSPLNVYMALSMLAETTDGESRQQILDLLGADSLESLRRQAGQVWESNYCQDGAVTSVLANSLWLDQKIPFRQETLNRLADHYFASSYWGRMGSEEMNGQLQSWINRQTGELLKDQASGLRMEEGTLMALASTIYFRAKWGSEFSEANTKEGIFHGLQGDSSHEFMHGNCTTYYWGEDFGAVYKRLEGSGGMWLILPDEGKTPQQVLAGDQVMELFLSEEDWENQKAMTVNLAMPKFDVVSSFDLREGLTELGVRDVFDSRNSDFTPLTEIADGMFVSRADHAARVMVDEEGCMAAAYTVMALAGSAMPPDEEMDFVLDRPFIFVITGESGLPLFAGIVNQP